MLNKIDLYSIIETINGFDNASCSLVKLYQLTPWVKYYPNWILDTDGHLEIKEEGISLTNKGFPYTDDVSATIRAMNSYYLDKPKQYVSMVERYNKSGFKLNGSDDTANFIPLLLSENMYPDEIETLTNSKHVSITHNGGHRPLVMIDFIGVEECKLEDLPRNRVIIVDYLYKDTSMVKVSWDTLLVLNEMECVEKAKEQYTEDEYWVFKSRSTANRVAHNKTYINMDTLKHMDTTMIKIKGTLSDISKTVGACNTFQKCYPNRRDRYMGPVTALDPNYVFPLIADLVTGRLGHRDIIELVTDNFISFEMENITDIEKMRMKTLRSKVTQYSSRVDYLHRRLDKYRETFRANSNATRLAPNEYPLISSNDDIIKALKQLMPDTVIPDYLLKTEYVELKDVLLRSSDIRVSAIANKRALVIVIDEQVLDISHLLESFKSNVPKTYKKLKRVRITR